MMLSGIHSTRLLRCAMLAACALVGGWSTESIADTKPAKEVPVTKEAPATKQVPPTGPVVKEGQPSSDVGSQYIIGPGDMIQIFVWRSPELTVSVPVRPDGKVSSPLVEDMVAVGKTPTQLARDIETRLAEYIRSPQVSIIVNTPLSAFSQVKVLGQVKAPQALAYREGMTILDAVLAVGGLTDFASGNKTKILRKDANGKETTIKVRVEDILRKGKLSENQMLKPGDVIVVPESIL
jgi:polysaccharide export outer membrane protein